VSRELESLSDDTLHEITEPPLRFFFEGVLASKIHLAEDRTENF